MMIQVRRVTQSYYLFAKNKYMPFIEQLAYKIGNNRSQREDFVCIGIEELLKCIVCYNQSSAFTTFLYSRLSGMMRNLKAKQEKTQRIKIVPIDDNFISVNHQTDINDTITDYINQLTQLERFVITELFFNCRTMREISNLCGTVPSVVYNTKQRAIAKMKSRYIQEG